MTEATTLSPNANNSSYQNPIGLSDPTIPEMDMEMDLAELDALDLEAFDLGADLNALENQVSNEVAHFQNLAAEIDEDVLADIGRTVVDGFDTDKQTRSALETTLRIGFENLTPMNNAGGSVPFEGACDIVHPLIRENAVKYQAKFTKALLPADGPARTEARDSDDPLLTKVALRHQRRLNRLLQEDMKEFTNNTERLFLYMPLTGTGVKKIYFDTTLNRPVSEFVKIDDFVINDLATDFNSAQRYTHVIYKTKNELKKDIYAGLYLDVFADDIGKQVTPQMPIRDILAQTEAEALDEPDIGSDTEVFTLYEQYVDLTLEGTPFEDPNGIARPYVVTVDSDSNRVLSIRRNWREADDFLKRKIINFVKYTFVPSTGFYGLGLFHLLGDFQKTLTAIVRSLVDSASFANLQAGFKKKGVRWVGSNEPLKPGEFRDIDILGNERISDVIEVLPFKEPSPTLMALLEFLTASGQKFADSIEQVTQDSVNYGKVGTTMALMEESQQFFSSIFTRVYKSMLEELRIIAELADKYMDDPNLKLDVDGDGVLDIGPASDPNYPTRAHKLSLAQTELNLALQAPQVHDLRAAYRNFYLRMGESEEVIRAILPEPDQAQPNDPLTDIQMAGLGKPIKAFPGQDHQAHIQVKTAFLQDPMMQSNPLLGPAGPAIQANIREHLVLSYIEQVKGVAQTQKLAGEVGMAQAAQQVLQANTALAEQNQAGGEMGQADMVYAQAEATKAAAMVEKTEAEKVFKTVDALNDAAKIDLERQKEENRAREAAAELSIKASKVDDDRTSNEVKSYLQKLDLSTKQALARAKTMFKRES